MISVCPYFHVHQPYRIKRYSVFEIGTGSDYFDEAGQNDRNNQRILEKVAEKSYRPMTTVLQHLLDTQPDFRFTLSFSGTVLDQFETFAPDVLEAFQRLVASGRVEIVGDTYYHSLAFFYSLPEFERQVAMHKKRIEELFHVTPTVFRNTELSYRNDLAKWCEDHGYTAIMAEGWDPLLGWRSPNFVYTPAGCSKIKVLLKNYKLSDDLAFRFGNRGWESWPLTSETYTQWIESHHGNAQTINLFMDFETFGEHQWSDTGIFEFIHALPGKLLAGNEITFKTVSETADDYQSVGIFDAPSVLTWADSDRDLTAWIGNDMQQEAIACIYSLETDVLKTKDKSIIELWRKLQTSDHFYYMCTKWFNDGDVHAYFSPYESPYEAFIAFMNAFSDLQLQVQKALAIQVVQKTTTKDIHEDVILQQTTWWNKLVSWWYDITRSFKKHFYDKKT